VRLEKQVPISTSEPTPDSPGETGIPATVKLPMDGVLDLHTFRPRDVKDLVLEYIEECQRSGIRRIRIVHGKGIGQLREIVHAVLKQHPAVISFRLASSGLGGWGATLVDLHGNPG
jgi:dsDNA-specific endonuclease/ATPase MutS2